MNTSKTGRAFELDNVQARRIVAVRDADIGPAGINPNAWRYVWTAEDVDILDLTREPQFAAHQVKRVSGVVDDASFSRAPKWYLMGVADCYDPSVYLIRADNECDALSIFETEFEAQVKIDDADLADYGENYSVNDNGTPVDTESVFMHEMRVIQIDL